MQSDFNCIIPNNKTLSNLHYSAIELEKSISSIYKFLFLMIKSFLFICFLTRTLSTRIRCKSSCRSKNQLTVELNREEFFNKISGTINKRESCVFRLSRRTKRFFRGSKCAPDKNNKGKRELGMQVDRVRESPN